jgi:putative sigma-54 modulation protein
MEIKVQSIHFDADKKLEDFINEKVSKLSALHEHITTGEVFLRLDKNESGDNKIAEIKLNVPGKELFAKRQCKTFEEAIDLSVEALRTQVKKYKGKLTSR